LGLVPMRWQRGLGGGTRCPSERAPLGGGAHPPRPQTVGERLNKTTTLSPAGEPRANCLPGVASHALAVAFHFRGQLTHLILA
jgi:hypothetical protein